MRQSDVRICLGLGVRTYQYYEGDEHRPDYEMLIKAGRFVDVSTDYLLGRSQERLVETRRGRTHSPPLQGVLLIEGNSEKGDTCLLPPG